MELTRVYRHWNKLCLGFLQEIDLNYLNYNNQQGLRRYILFQYASEVQDFLHKEAGFCKKQIIPASLYGRI